ncbi:hypothetical protein CVT25_000592 [Psilocybe cyanescens]|uniref:Uncharacterized protein n=1 Tax=Psilocybe cyanescens TaxID=93625 RepID=A0A409XM12_PSICY|nr:hypothetical protein CVT25_000592 [Psilocybe cyanescens]
MRMHRDTVDIVADIAVVNIVADTAPVDTVLAGTARAGTARAGTSAAADTDIVFKTSKISMAELILAAASQSNGPINKNDESHIQPRPALSKPNLSLAKSHDPSLLTFMRRLPVELIQKIFIQSRSPCFDEHQSMWMSRSQLPWALTQVCHSWRQISLSTPELWKQLPTLELQQMYTRNGAYLDYLNEVLKRSKNLPIDIHINSCSSTDLPLPVLDILLQHSERWGMLRLEACHAIMPLLQPAKGRLTSLRRLTLVFRWDWEFHSAPSHELFQDAPALNDVYLENSTGDFILPPGQLISYHQCRNRLSEIPTSSKMSLTSLTLDGVTPTSWLPSITLPFLASLKITQRPGVAIPQCTWFFDNVTLPALTVLTINETTDEIVKSVQLMIARSHSPCKLEDLAFQWVPISPVSFTNLLEQTPLLKFLSIPLPPLQDLHALIFDSSRPHLIPHLRELYLSAQRITEETKNVLINLASSRCGPQPIPTCEDLLPMHVGDSQFEKLSLSFPSTAIAEQHLYGFEGWKESDACAQLKRFETLLFNILPEVYRRPNPRRHRLDLERKNRVSALLDQIEVLVIEDPKDLAVRFSSPSLAFNLMGKDFDGLSKQAERILSSWEPLFRVGIECNQWTICFGTLVHLTKSVPQPVYLSTSTST